MSKTQNKIDLAFQAIQACKEAGVDPYAIQCLWSCVRAFQCYVNTTAPLLMELRRIREASAPPSGEHLQPSGRQVNDD